MKGQLKKGDYVIYNDKHIYLPAKTEVKFDVSNEKNFQDNLPMVDVILEGGTRLSIHGNLIIATEAETTEDYNFIIKLNNAINRKKKVFAFETNHENSVLFEKERFESVDLLFEVSNNKNYVTTKSIIYDEKIQRSIFRDMIFNIAREEGLETYRITEDIFKNCCYVKRHTKNRKSKVVGKYNNVFEAMKNLK